MATWFRAGTTREHTVVAVAGVVLVVVAVVVVVVTGRRGRGRGAGHLDRSRETLGERLERGYLGPQAGDPQPHAAESRSEWRPWRCPRCIVAASAACSRRWPRSSGCMRVARRPVSAERCAESGVQPLLTWPGASVASCGRTRAQEPAPRGGSRWPAVRGGARRERLEPDRGEPTQCGRGEREDHPVAGTDDGRRSRVVHTDHALGRVGVDRPQRDADPAAVPRQDG